MLWPGHAATSKARPDWLPGQTQHFWASCLCQDLLPLHAMVLGHCFPCPCPQAFPLTLSVKPCTQVTSCGLPYRYCMPQATSISSPTLSTHPHHWPLVVVLLCPLPSETKKAASCLPSNCGPALAQWSENESHSVMSNSLPPDRLSSPRNSPDQNTGVGSLSLLQGIFPPRDQTQVSHIAGGFFISWATREAKEYWSG